MRILQIVFLLSVCGRFQAVRIPISDILEIARLSKNVTIDVVKTINLLDEDIELSSKVIGQRFLFKEFNIIKNKIDIFNAQFKGKRSLVLKEIVAFTFVDPKLREANDDILIINDKYARMVAYINSKAAVKDLTLEHFAWNNVPQPQHSYNSIQSLLDRIHVIITSPEDGIPNVFEILIKTMKVRFHQMFCYMQASTQQLLFKLYNELALKELKGFLLIEFSYMILKLHNFGNYTKEMETAQERYKDRSATILKLFRGAVPFAQDEFWMCEPYGFEQVKNKTYIEITELLQGHIENEEDLNHMRLCYKRCDHYNETESYNCEHYGYQFCKKNRECKGKLINCHFIEDASVCFADAGTNRRYEYIDQAGKILGRRKDCGSNLTTYENWNRWGIESWACNYCMCFCDEQGVNSDRYFSMRSSESDIHHNMVVTGLRFMKKNRIIHLQIQEGKLLPYAKINGSSVRWKPVEDYRINDFGVHDGQDYHTLTWEKRGFDLDDLVTKEEELLTGVRLRMTASNLHLEIRKTPFNFTTGTLEVEKSKWIHNKISQKDREKVNLDNRDIPIRDPYKSRFDSILSTPDMYLEFTHTDLDKDAAQTTVPFIDAQAVALEQPVPLRGAGVMYHGDKNFGGFINLKVMTYNYSEFLHEAYDDTKYDVSALEAPSPIKRR